MCATSLLEMYAFDIKIGVNSHGFFFFIHQSFDQTR